MPRQTGIDAPADGRYPFCEAGGRLKSDKRIEVKGQLQGQPVRLTTNERCKAQQPAEATAVAGTKD